jgi:DNA-binding NarL/FixJ family response regulator
MIKILVFDDNRGILQGLALLINQSSGMKCVGAFENCLDIMTQVNQLQPDVVLMDIRIFMSQSTNPLKVIREYSPETIIIMQAVFEEDEKIFESILSGAHGYFLKKTPPIKLIDGIRNAYNGGAPMSAFVARKILRIFRKQSFTLARIFPLTDSEQKILECLEKGMSYQMIAQRKNVDIATVHAGCKEIYSKLHKNGALGIGRLRMSESFPDINSLIFRQ